MDKLLGLIVGYNTRKKLLPNSIASIRNTTFELKSTLDDGRLNSSIDEYYVLKKLETKFGKRIVIPKSRMWYDFLLLDYRYGWLPVNIKITTLKTPDNSCNFTGLVHSLTTEVLDYSKYYKNGEMSKLLVKHMEAGNINKNFKKDYYFLVIDKINGSIYVNSILGLSEMTPNINNLPFQIKWSKNKKYMPTSILNTCEMFSDLYNSPKENWKDYFISKMKNKGQYFTKNKILQEKVKEFVKHESGIILEPSIGRGDLISIFPNREFEMYEIDSSIDFLENINTNSIHFGDFLTKQVIKKFKTIIANPPYVKLKNGNLYLKFIDKCFDLLEEDGEMIFIVPSEFFKITSASKILTKMCKYGSFSHVFHPNDEKMFDEAIVDVLIFRYSKTPQKVKTTLYNGKCMYLLEESGIITFTEELNDNVRLGEFMHVKVGIVSGYDKIFKNLNGNLEVITSENTIQKFLMYEEFPYDEPIVSKYLLDNKNELINRKIKKFNENNWFQWGCLRNVNFVKQNFGKPCIYIHNISRKENVAFIGNVKFFSGNLLLLLPKQDINLSRIVEYLNSETYKKNYTFSKRFKVGQKQVVFSSIPRELFS